MEYLIKHETEKGLTVTVTGKGKAVSFLRMLCNTSSWSVIWMQGKEKVSMNGFEFWSREEK